MDGWVVFEVFEEGSGIEPSVDAVYETKMEALMAAAKVRRDGWNAVLKKDNPERDVEWHCYKNGDDVQFWLDADSIHVSKVKFYKKHEFIIETDEKEGGESAIDLRDRACNSVENKMFVE
jgi:hypothetical protein